MPFDLPRWRAELRDGLRDPRRSMTRLGVRSVYGFVAASALLPVLNAAASGEGTLATLLALAGGVGGNLLAEHLQGWKERAADPNASRDLAAVLVERAATNPALRAELDRLFKELGVMSEARAALSAEDRAWLRDALLEEIGKIRRGDYHALVAGSGAVAQGDGGVALGEGAKYAGRDIVERQSNIEVGEIRDAKEVVVGTKIVNEAHDSVAAALTAARTRYLRGLIQRCNALPLAAMGGEKGGRQPLHLFDVYVALDTATTVPLSDEEKEHRRQERGFPLSLDDRATRPLTALEAAAKESHLVLLGDPGGGKSSFVFYLAAHLAAACIQAKPYRGWPEGMLPVVVALRELAPRLSALDLNGPADERRERQVAAIWEQWRAELARLEAAEFEAGLRDALETGNVLLVLDGLDEMAVALRERVRLAVGALLERYPLWRVIVTCRARSYEGEAVLPGFAQERLLPFNEEQIARFIRAWYGAQQAAGRLTEEVARERIAELTGAARSRDLRELSENPMLLTAMAVIHQQDTRLPTQRVLLYSRVVELLMERWQSHKGVGISEALRALLRDKRPLRLVMERLGYEAHSTQAAQRGEGDLTRGELIMLLEGQEYLKGLALVEEFLDYVDQRAGVLVGRGGGDGSRPALYRFPHRTFQEYLAGCHLLSGQRRDFVPTVQRRAAEGDFWQVAMLLGAEEKFYGGDTATVLDLAYKLCPNAEPGEAAAWRALLWSGLLARLVGSEAIEADGEDPDYLARLIPRLVRLLKGDALPAIERAEAGRVLAALGDPRPEATTIEGMEFCWVPPGPFWMGSPDDDEMGLGFERPLHERTIPYGYWLARFPVTNGQWQQFLDDPEGYHDPAGRWWEGLLRREPDSPTWSYRNHPRESVDWFEVLAFCRWLTGRGRRAGWLPEGWRVVLPSEAEWEKGARGGTTLPPPGDPIALAAGLHDPDTRPKRSNEQPRRRFPWGDEPDPQRANYDETAIGATSAVGAFAAGCSPYGCEEMSGNVWEWTRSAWDETYGKPEFRDSSRVDDRPEDLTSYTMPLSLRGGSFADFEGDARCACRGYEPPPFRYWHRGFRVAVSPAAGRG